jgi:hypothetical protein
LNVGTTNFSTLIKIQKGTRGGVTLWALPFTLNHVLRQKRRIIETPNISPCENIIFKKFSKRNQNPSRYYN